MRFPSDDELMAGPNAFDQPESLDEDVADAEDLDGAELNEEGIEESLARLENLKTLREETNAGAGLVMPEYPKDYRAGFVSIVGRPNVGKSTLTNALVGAKIAITSLRPETTRHNIRGIVHADKSQLILVDTPGYHRPRTLLGKRLNDMVREALSEVDCVVFCLPADQKIGPGDRFIARELKEVRRPIIAVATKIDRVSREKLMEHLLAVDALGEFAAIVPVSALSGEGVDILLDVLRNTVPLSPPLYPEGDLTDESRETLIAEYIREAALEELHDELPHSLAVQVEEIVERDRPDNSERPALVDVRVNLFVERNSQKAIIIGKKGSRIKDIGSQSRPRIEELLGRRVYLDLHVRTAKDWQSDPKMLGRLGF